MDNNTTSILYDSHMHTPFCKHAWGTPTDYAAVAEKRGLKGIVFTCHNPGPDGWSSKVRMEMSQFDEYVEMVENASLEWDGRIDIRLGLECDYVPGMESWLEDLLGKAEFHHILGSIHPNLPYYKEAYFQDDVLKYQRTYFEHLAMAAESGLFDTLSHPDLVKNVFPRKWDIDLIMDDIKRNLDCIAKTGVAMEINTSGLQKSIKEMNPFPRMLVEMKERNIPIVLGSDAHQPARVGADFSKALDLLEDAGYTHVHHYLDRQRRELSLMDCRESIENTAVSLAEFPERIRSSMRKIIGKNKDD